MRLFLFVLATAIGLSASAVETERPVSAKRHAGESFEEALSRAYEEARVPLAPLSQEQQWPASALDEAKPFAELTFERVPVWSDQGEQSVQGRFEEIRDLRFLTDPAKSDFPRRISWLYPDDGCFARAALIKDQLTNKNNLPSARVFIFGNLNVKTDNSPWGQVSWWYHTAFIVRKGDEVMVFDPAIEPQAPLPLRDWVLRQVPDVAQATLSICSAETYAPSSPCAKAEGDSERGYRDIPYYLSEERHRQESLGRNPDEVLGENPPWLVTNPVPAVGLSSNGERLQRLVP